MVALTIFIVNTCLNALLMRRGRVALSILLVTANRESSAPSPADRSCGGFVDDR